MVCDGPDPPDNTPRELTPPPRTSFVANANDESDDAEFSDYEDYEPLPQGPDELPFQVHSPHLYSNDDEEENSNENGNEMPQIEPIDSILARQVWSEPRRADNIQMDNERAQQVIEAMANFALPQSSIPQWAQSVPEHQWKDTLNERIEKLRSK